jgi:aspartate aminotransferase
MSTTLTSVKEEMIVSNIAENIIGSEILKLSAEINEKLRNGEKIFNYTVGDFNPKIFPIPAELKKEIMNAYEQDETNYPPADGILDLRQAVSEFLRTKCKLDYPADQILIAGGARPIIYGIFRALVDAGEKVLFPIPSWNNNHYTYLLQATSIMIEARPENNFMPTAGELAPYLSEAAMVSLCSPLNPTGTTFTREGLEAICDLVIEENRKRKAIGKKPLYVLYDQIYWALTYGNTQHYNPVSLRPEMREYTVFVDGISKSLAATGVRVGWTMGPKKIIDKMKSIIGHVGAWAPRAEQVAVAKFLRSTNSYESFVKDIREKINERLTEFHEGFQQLKKEGFNVDSIAPQAAIYLTVKFALHGKKTPEGKTLSTTKDVTSFILNEAKVAMVPFYAFGTSVDSPWYRLSVGTAKSGEAKQVVEALRNAMNKLS